MCENLTFHTTNELTMPHYPLHSENAPVEAYPDDSHCCLNCSMYWRQCRGNLIMIKCSVIFFFFFNILYFGFWLKISWVCPNGWYKGDMNLIRLLLLGLLWKINQTEPVPQNIRRSRGSYYDTRVPCKKQQTIPSRACFPMQGSVEDGVCLHHILLDHSFGQVHLPHASAILFISCY